MVRRHGNTTQGLADKMGPGWVDFAPDISGGRPVGISSADFGLVSGVGDENKMVPLNCGRGGGFRGIILVIRGGTSANAASKVSPK